MSMTENLEAHFRSLDEAQAAHSIHLCTYVRLVEARASHVREERWHEAERLELQILAAALKLARCNADASGAVREIARVAA